MIDFASGPMGPEANNLNPTTFLTYMEDRKCEKLWTLPEIETGKKDPSLTMLKKLSDGLSISLSQLLKDL